MPQLHHRDPSIIGLLGSSPFVASKPSSLPLIITQPGRAISPAGSVPSTPKKPAPGPYASEAFDDIKTPSETPALTPYSQTYGGPNLSQLGSLLNRVSTTPTQLNSNEVTPGTPFKRPFYELIVDGVHSHPNSVRVGSCPFRIDCS